MFDGNNDKTDSNIIETDCDAEAINLFSYEKKKKKNRKVGKDVKRYQRLEE